MEHLLHHSFALSTTLAGSANGGPWCTYFSVFFYGVVELSSVPLCAVDLYRAIPSLLTDPVHSMINELCRTAFALSFLVVRCGVFPILMCTQMWPDMYHVFDAGDVRVSRQVFLWMGFGALVLTALQLFWGFKIVRVITSGNLKGKNAKATATETD